MASRFVVVVALFAVCHSSPAIRDARSYGIGSSSGYGGVNKASASVRGNDAEAYGINDNGGNVARDAFGNGLLGQAFAKASNEGSPDGPVGVGIAQPAYYHVPAPANVVTYQQYADVPETPSQIVYEQGPALAQSSAITNGGSADSNANVGYDTAASNARAQGGFSSASSLATNNGIATPVASNENPESSITAARTQGFNNVYTPVHSGYGAASSNANVNGHYGAASSSAKTGPTRKSISWRFGTAYDNPASYVRSGASYHGYNSANANANVHSGHGTAKSAAQLHGAGSGSANSVANANSGYANANAGVNNAGYAVLRTGEDSGYGYVNAATNSHDNGVANANADVNAFGIKSASSTIGNASAKSSANNAPGYGFRSSGWGSGAGRTAADAHSKGLGNANSSARTQGVSTGYRVVDTNANSYGSGSALANAYSA